MGYGYGYCCCDNLACGWTPRLTNTIIRRLSGDLALNIPASGSAALPIFSSGVGTSVGEGKIGTKTIGVGSYLYGRIIPTDEECYSGEFTVVLPSIFAEDVNGAITCRYEGGGAVLTLEFHEMVGRCCYYVGGTTYNGATLQLDLDRGVAQLRVIVPAVSGGPTCGLGWQRIYVGYFGRDGGSVTLTENNTVSNCGVVPDVPGSRPDPEESGNFPSSLDVVPVVASTAERVWLGIRNSVGVAWEPAARKFLAVELDSTGQITSTLGEHEIDVPTFAAFAAFWWTDINTVQFAWFDQIRVPGFYFHGYEVKDFIVVDHSAPLPEPSIRTGYVGANGEYNGFRAFISCIGQDCFEDYTNNQTTQRPPFFQYVRFPVPATGANVTCFQMTSSTERRLHQEGTHCRWVSAGLEGSAPDRIYGVWEMDVGMTDPDKVTLSIRLHDDNPFATAQIVVYTMPIGSYDGFRTVTLNLESDTGGGPGCVFPPTVTTTPAP